MEEIKSSPILKFNENQLRDVRKVIGYDDVNKLKQDIEHLKEWIAKQNHFTVKEFSPEYLERLLIQNKGSIERAKQKLDKLCTFTNLMPEFLQNFDIKNEFRNLFEIGNMFVTPRPTNDNYRLVYTSATGKDTDDFQLIQYYRYLIVFGHYMLYNDYCQGFEIILDTRNITTGVLMKMNPVVIHKGITLLVEALSQRMKRIHLLTSSKFLDTIVTLLKQGLTAKLKQRLIVHTSIESLYDYVPKELLPEDYGGEEKSMKELCDLDFNELCSEEHIANVKFMETVATNESQRLSSKFNEEYSGTPGSFKTLCVD